MTEKPRHGPANPESSHGRPADMSWSAVRRRLLMYVPIGARGNTHVTVRVADLRTAVEMADTADGSPDVAAEYQKLLRRVHRAVKLLGSIGDEDDVHGR
jgi:hypothetical protein